MTVKIPESEVKMDNEKKNGTAVKTVGLMMGATVAAKLLGMLRSILQANNYGAESGIINAFTAASKLPVTFFDLLLSAAVLGCFIPVYNSFAKKDDIDASSKEADDFACIFLNFIMLMCGILAIAGMIFAEPLIKLITHDLSAEHLALAVTLARIMFPLVIFAGAAYTLVGVLQSKGSYIIPAFISAISNAGVVIYLAVIDKRLGDSSIYGLAVAYTCSWLIQLLTLVIPLWKKGFRYKALLNLKNPAFIKAIKMTPPIIIGAWLSPASILLGQFHASNLPLEGATTMFDYANNVFIIIAGTLTYSICNYTFPKISRMAAVGDEKGYAETVGGAITSALFIVLPFMAAAEVLSGEGISIMYQRGEFTSNAAGNTALALRFILPAMPFFCMTELFSRVFYSKNMVKIPMLAAICGVVSNFAVGFICVKLGLFGIGAVGAATASGHIVSAIVLLIFAKKKVKGIFSKKLLADVIKIFIGSAAVFAVSFGIKTLIGSNPYEDGFFKNVINALIIFTPSAVIYLIWAKLAHIKVGTM